MQINRRFSSFWQVAQARCRLGKVAQAGFQSHLPLAGASCAVKTYATVRGGPVGFLSKSLPGFTH